MRTRHRRYVGEGRWKGPSDAALKWEAHKRCLHRWSVFVSGKDDRPWVYCLKCGELHPGER